MFAFPSRMFFERKATQLCRSHTLQPTMSPTEADDQSQADWTDMKGRNENRIKSLVKKGFFPASRFT